MLEVQFGDTEGKTTPAQPGTPTVPAGPEGAQPAGQQGAQPASQQGAQPASQQGAQPATPEGVQAPGQKPADKN
jgi:hypothetical protein